MTMPNEIGSIWENRTHPGSYILVTAKKRYYYFFYYLDEPETTLIIDIDKLGDIFKKIS